MIPTLSVSELQRKIKNHHVLIIDVREPDEYTQSHIAGAVNISLGKLIRDHSKGIIPSDKEVVVHCKTGVRGAIAADFLTQRGFTNVKNLDGGYAAWEQT